MMRFNPDLLRRSILFAITFTVLTYSTQAEIDFGKGIFKEYQEYPTSTGFVINNAKEAMAFNNFHEGLHIRIMMSMRKLV